jgi:type 1 glutamine amidotransferase
MLQFLLEQVMNRSMSWVLSAILLAAAPGVRARTPQEVKKQTELKSAEPAPSQTGSRKRLLVITQSDGFVHEPVKRKVTLAPGVDLAELKKFPNLELKVLTTKGKEVAAYSGRLDSPAPMQFFADKDKDKPRLLATVTPCLAELTFIELGKKNGFDVVGSQDARAEITAENLKNFDAVWFYTTGELPLSESQKEAFLAFVKNGKGFGGSHSATDTFYKWKEYGDLIGAYFDGHPWTTTVNIIVEDKTHPSTKHLGGEFSIKDEIYEFKGPYDRSKLHVLMHMQHTSNMKQGKRADQDNAIAWTNDYGKGRVFYTGLGHFPEVWQDPRFQEHILGAVRYLFGQ